MRRAFHILVCFTLVLATTGLSISKHYCGNSLVRTSLGTEVKSCMPDMDMGSGCCDEKTETLVIEDDFELSQSQIKIVPAYDLLIAYLISELDIEPAETNYSVLTFNDTGPPETEPLYLRVQSLLL